MNVYEQTQDLVKKYSKFCWNDGIFNIEMLKDLAIISIDETLLTLDQILVGEQQPSDECFYWFEHWENVKEEIKKGNF